MIGQKEGLIPKVGGVDVVGWDASINFTTDAIEFVNSSKDWSIDLDGFGTVAVGTPTLTILVSNKKDGDYIPYKEDAKDIDLTVEVNRVIFDDIMPLRYMKIKYVSGGSTGSFSLEVVR